MNRDERIYQFDPYRKELLTQIMEVIATAPLLGLAKEQHQKDPIFMVRLAETIFFPEGGGQPSDRGVLITSSQEAFPVLDAFLQDGTVYHHVRLPNESALSVGMQITAKIDWDFRFENMQRHCGEHILSAAFYDLFGGINRGFHMGEQSMTIDICLPDAEEPIELDDLKISAAEDAANRLVFENLPISIRHFDTKEEAEGLPMRKELTLLEDITLVSVGSEDWAPGCVACCGTHPKTTGSVGLIKIYRWEKYKGMYRITFDAGQKAYQHAKQSEDLLKTLCRRYSAEPSTLIERLNASDQKQKELRQDLHDLRNVYYADHAAEIGTATLTSNVPVIREFTALHADDLSALAKFLPKDFKGLVVLISAKELSLWLQSNGTPDCGKAVRDNAAVWNGKGGGKADYARVLFSSRQDLDCFVDYLSKAFVRKEKNR